MMDESSPFPDSPTTKPAVSRSLFKKLREETRQTHQELEAQLNLLDRMLDIEEYCGLLERFYGFYVPWESRVYRMTAGLLPDREKTSLLAQDLRHFGSNPETLALCPYVPQPVSQAEAFGSMYVIEGSTLGGQLISRHLEKSLAFTNGDGYRFFRSYGPDVSRQWKLFQSTVIAHSSEADDPEIIRAANETFQVLQRWLMQAEAVRS